MLGMAHGLGMSGEDSRAGREQRDSILCLALKTNEVAENRRYRTELSYKHVTDD